MAEPTGRRSRIALTVVALAVVGIAVFDAVVVWEWTSGQPYSYPYWLESTVGGLAYAAVGIVITVRVPHNPIGPIMLAVPVLSAIQGIGGTAALPGAAHGWPLPLIALGGGAFGGAQDAVVGTVALLLLVAPEGHVLSARWRRVVATLSVLVGIAVIAQFLAGPQFAADGPPRDDSLPGYPDGVALVPSGPAGVLQVVAEVGLAGTVVCVGLGVVSLVRRWWTSDAEGRRRSGWAIAGAVGTPLLILVTLPVPSVTIHGGDLAWATAVLLFPLGIAVAVLRHGLYDLDRVVSRTVSYAIVTAAVLLVYVVIVTSVTRLLGSQPTLVVAGSTLAAAALFRPLLQRVQGAVDRRFNRQKVDGQRAVAGFGARLRDEVDLGVVEHELLAVARRSLEPSTTSVWLRQGAP